MEIQHQHQTTACSSDCNSWKCLWSSSYNLKYITRQFQENIKLWKLCQCVCSLWNKAYTARRTIWVLKCPCVLLFRWHHFFKSWPWTTPDCICVFFCCLWGFSKKNAETHVVLHGNFSAPVWVMGMVEASKNTTGLLVYTRKKFFAWGYGFIVSDVISGGLLGHLARPRALTVRW